MLKNSPLQLPSFLLTERLRFKWIFFAASHPSHRSCKKVSFPYSSPLRPRPRLEAPTTMSRCSTLAGPVSLASFLSSGRVTFIILLLCPKSSIYYAKKHIYLYHTITSVTFAQIMLESRVTNSSTCIHLTEARTHERESGGVLFSRETANKRRGNVR